ncbi:hypothetical protein QRT08_16795 [Halalkalicoccus sp. NIPERK01]|nr:hypothetical protein [Halalkalicoccus sp. NIPERK01]MDL5363623.1 hypothetical protein [Halalkalicoccus sp. NIPERK01]
MFRRAVLPIWHGVPTLLVEFSASSVTTADAGSIVLTVDDTSHELTREGAADLRAAIEEALTERHDFFRTAGEYREDGSYVVSRRGAESAGNAKVFEDFDCLRRLYDRLPATITAEDVGRSGITGSRRHMLVRHFAEHPAFDCRIANRSPLTVEKT